MSFVYLIGCCALVSISIETLIIFGVTDITIEGIDISLFAKILKNISITRFLIIMIIILLLIIFIKKMEIPIFEWIFKSRYFIGFIAIVFCVAFEISGSSIGCFDEYLPADNTESGVLWGHERLVRQDEWQKNTPMAFSQEYNKTGKYPYYSDTIRGTKTDTFIVYGQPVWNLLVVFRPFHLGYLLLGSSRGLAFFWTSRLVALFLVSIELFMILTNKNKEYSLIGSILVSFSPVVQWWFAINGFVEMLIFGQLAIVCLHKYMNTSSIMRKVLYIVTMAICSGGYFLTFYPAWQVPFFFVFLVVTIGIIAENYKAAKITLRVDGAMLLILIGILAAFFSGLLYMSFDTIKAIMNTAYPGKRSIYGGDGNLLYLFRYFNNIFLPLTNHNIEPLYNESEAARFFDFFPLGIIFAIVFEVKTRKKDILNILLTCLTGVLVLYVLIPWPQMIATITLMKYSSAARAVIVIGYINILLLMRNLPRLEIKRKELHTVVIALVTTVGISSAAYHDAQGYVGGFMLVIMFVVGGLGCYLIMAKRGRALLGYVVIVVMGTGLLVNPVQRGVDVIYNNPLTQAIYETAQEHEGSWITDNIPTPLFNLTIMVGAPTINSINIYPNLELWYKIDKDRMYEDIYNRQAHIGLSIIEEDSRFELMGGSSFMLYLNVDDVEILGVKYILSSRDLTVFNNYNIQFSCVKQIDDFFIFEAQY